MRVECVLRVLGREARGRKERIQGQVHHVVKLEENWPKTKKAIFQPEQIQI